MILPIPTAPQSLVFSLNICKLALNKHVYKRNWSFSEYTQFSANYKDLMSRPQHLKWPFLKHIVKEIFFQKLSKGILIFLIYNVFFPYLNPRNAKTHIIDYCPRCAFPTYIVNDNKNIPTHLEHGEWQCTHCRARREWNKEKAREQIWNIYKVWYNSQQCFQRSIYVLSLLGIYAEALACGVEWLAPIHFFTHVQSRIGHLAVNTAAYLHAKKIGALPPSLDFYGTDCHQTTANWYLLDKWTQYMGSTHLTQYIPGAQWFGVPEEQNIRDIFNATETSGILPLTFSQEENDLAQIELAKMGIPQDAKIVTLLCRDSKYLSTIMPKSDWSYHNYRDVDVNTYRIAAEFLASQGYYILRMGAAPKEAITWTSDHIIDYASNFRTEFMDVWLFANCYFCISTGTGPDAIASSNRVPVLWINFPLAQYCVSWSKNNITLFKDIIDIKTNTVVPIKELLNPNNPLGRCMYANKLQQLGYTWRDNTPEEILEATKDMLLLLNGKLILSSEEQARQEELWELVKEAKCDYSGERLHPKELTYHGFFARKYTRDFLHTVV